MSTPIDDFASIFDVGPRPNPVCEDVTQSPEYAAFVESMAQHCRCLRDCPCDGVLAGGICDGIVDRDDGDEPSCDEE